MMAENKQSLADDECEVAIIGAGPAGLAAAAVLRERGAGVTIIDEQPSAGGQILRQPPRDFAVAHWLPAKLHDRVKSVLHAVSDRADIDWRLRSTVLGIMRPSPYRVQRARSDQTTAELQQPPTSASDPGANERGGASQRAAHQLWIQGPDGCYLLRAKAVLLAPGCYERPLAFPGWTLPGVMSAGAIQGFIESEQLVPGHRFLLAGSHPWQLVVADQLLSAGAQLSAVVFTQRRQRVWSMLRHPLVAIRYARQLIESAQILNRLRRARVPVIFGKTIVRVDGSSQVERATIATLHADATIERHQTQVFECDRVGICHGFLASSELAGQAGADLYWSEHAGGWLARQDEWFESSVENLFVAGEITSVDGADAALEKGRLAAAGILRSLGRSSDRDASKSVSTARKRLSHLQRFAAVLQTWARPPAGLALQTMTDDTILCRCESITCGDLRQPLADNKHVMSADAAKSLTRVGMGLCQGRLCGDNLARLLAAERGVPPSAIGPFQAQVPVKPVPLAMLARRPRD